MKKLKALTILILVFMFIGMGSWSTAQGVEKIAYKHVQIKFFVLPGDSKDENPDGTKKPMEEKFDDAMVNRILNKVNNIYKNQTSEKVIDFETREKRVTVLPNKRRKCIVAGENKRVDTSATGDDVQVLRVGKTNVPEGKKIIATGANEEIDTTPSDDDKEVDDNEWLLIAAQQAYTDCHRGINVIFVPPDYDDGRGNWNGLSYIKRIFDAVGWGIKIRDTCNEEQMAKTIAHELLHTLGLSHEQTKWKDQTTGKVYVKWKVARDTWEYHDHDELCFRHAFHFEDKNKDCDTDDPDERFWDLDNNGVWTEGVDDWCRWDVNGDCNIDAADKEYLLWGCKELDGTKKGTKIDEKQYNCIFAKLNNPANEIKFNAKYEQVCKPTKKKVASVSGFSADEFGDLVTGYAYADLKGSLGLINYNSNVYKGWFNIEVIDEIPDNRYLKYGFYLDTDDNTSTGSPSGILQGADFKADVYIGPEITESKLWRWKTDRWVKVRTLDWGFEHVFQDVIGDGFGYETYSGDVLSIEVPLGDLDLVFDGGLMKVKAFAWDLADNILDVAPTMSLAMTKIFRPLINLFPHAGSHGATITVEGSEFTPNATVSIEFDGTEVTSKDTDNEGNFTATFIVPEVPDGYYPVSASDANGKYDSTIFVVPSCPICTIYITRAWTSDLNNNPKRTFKPGETIRYHIEYSVEGDPSTKYKAIGKIRVKGDFSDSLRKVEKVYPGTYEMVMEGTIPSQVYFGEAKVIFRTKLKEIGTGKTLDTDRKRRKIRIDARDP